jgi:hypothetical protein
LTFFHPLRWADDKSGVLPRLVAKFTDQPGELNHEEVSLLKEYLVEWLSDLSSAPEEAKGLLARPMNNEGLVQLVGRLRGLGVSPF